MRFHLKPGRICPLEVVVINGYTWSYCRKFGWHRPGEHP